MTNEKRWFENYRMEWIAEMLNIFGFVNREHLMRKFGISIPQASKDLNSFRRLHPDLIAYDLSLKRYVATSQMERKHVVQPEQGKDALSDGSR